MTLKFLGARETLSGRAIERRSLAWRGRVRLFYPDGSLQPAELQVGIIPMSPVPAVGSGDVGALIGAVQRSSRVKAVRGSQIACPSQTGRLASHTLRTGVCHQTANRILYPAGVKVTGARGYNASLNHVRRFWAWGMAKKKPVLRACGVFIGAHDLCRSSRPVASRKESRCHVVRRV